MAFYKPDNIMASIHIIQKRIDRLVYIVNLISTILFLEFYGYMIYSRMDDSYVRVGIYSILSLILIISLVFDIILYPGNSKIKNFLDKRKYKLHKKIKTRTINIIKFIVKAFSIAYATYELVIIDNSTMKLLTLIFSYSILIIQIAIYFAADILAKYWNYLYLGIMADYDELIIPIAHPLAKGQIREANNLIMTQKEKEIIEEINNQKKEDKATAKQNLIVKKEIANSARKNAKEIQKEKNKLFEIAMYCFNNNDKNVEDISKKFKISIDKAYEFLNVILEKGIITVTPNNSIAFLITNVNEIKKLIFSN